MHGKDNFRNNFEEGFNCIKTKNPKAFMLNVADLLERLSGEIRSYNDRREFQRITQNNFENICLNFYNEDNNRYNVESIGTGCLRFGDEPVVYSAKLREITE